MPFPHPKISSLESHANFVMLTIANLMGPVRGVFFFFCMAAYLSDTFFTSFSIFFINNMIKDTVAFPVRSISQCWVLYLLTDLARLLKQ